MSIYPAFVVVIATGRSYICIVHYIQLLSLSGSTSTAPTCCYCQSHCQHS